MSATLQLSTPNGTRVVSRITFQVAVEAITANPGAFSRGDAEIVLADAEHAGVDEFFLSMLREIIPTLNEF